MAVQLEVKDEQGIARANQSQALGAEAAERN